MSTVLDVQEVFPVIIYNVNGWRLLVHKESVACQKGLLPAISKICPMELTDNLYKNVNNKTLFAACYLC